MLFPAMLLPCVVKRGAAHSTWKKTQPNGRKSVKAIKLWPQLGGLSGGRRRLATVAAPEHFLHVGPGGDWWEGGGVYAAKHTPSDYVRSLPLPVGTRLRGAVRF